MFVNSFTTLTHIIIIIVIAVLIFIIVYTYICIILKMIKISTLKRSNLLFENINEMSFPS